MPRQISDEEFNFLQGRRQVADFVESIYNDPQLTREAKALIKKKYPNLQIPDFDIEARVEDRLNKDREERNAAEEKKRRDEEDAEFKRQRKATQDKHHFTDEAMTRLEQMMVDRNIGNYDDAATLMAAREPRASEPTYDNHFYNFDKQDSFKEIAKDPEAWGRAEIIKAIQVDQDRQRNG